MQWFRMYAEFATDPVVQSMSFDDQRHFVIILCLKCSGALDREFGDPQMRVAMLRRALGLEAMAFDEAKNRLCGSGLINGEWQPKNWEKRQFLSDHSAAERMRNYRKRHRDVTVTSRVTKSDVLDTESEADTDSEKKKTKKQSARARRVPADFQPDVDYAKQQVPDMDVDREIARFRDWEFKTARSDWAAVWRTWVGNCRDNGKYAKASNGAKTLEQNYPGYRF